MASVRQAQANQRNAQLSSGPRTESGKSRSRRNSLKDGLAGAGAILPDDALIAIAAAKDVWRHQLRPRGCDEEHLVAQIAFHSTQGSQVTILMALQKQQFARRATDCWDLDRTAEAEKLGRQLAEAPGLITSQLACFLHGCDWLLRRWATLSSALDERGRWSPAERHLAINLLGEVADDDSSDDELTREECAAMVADEKERLEVLRREVLEPQDDEQRVFAEVGLTAEHSPEMKRLRRYLAQHQRQWRWAWDQLMALRRSRLLEASLSRPSESNPTKPPAPSEAEKTATAQSKLATREQKLMQSVDKLIAKCEPPAAEPGVTFLPVSALPTPPTPAPMPTPAPEPKRLTRREYREERSRQHKLERQRKREQSAKQA